MNTQSWEDELDTTFEEIYPNHTSHTEGNGINESMAFDWESQLNEAYLKECDNFDAAAKKREAYESSWEFEIDESVAREAQKSKQNATLQESKAAIASSEEWNEWEEDVISEDEKNPNDTNKVNETVSTGDGGRLLESNDQALLEHDRNTENPSAFENQALIEVSDEVHAKDEQAVSTTSNDQLTKLGDESFKTDTINQEKSEKDENGIGKTDESKQIENNDSKKDSGGGGCCNIQ